MSHDEKINYIIQLYNLCIGRNKIEPRDTYTWRYASKFLQRMETMSVEWSTIKKIVYYASKNKQGGISQLTYKKVIDQCINDALFDVQQQTLECDVLKRNYDFFLLSGHAPGGSNDGLAS